MAFGLFFLVAFVTYSQEDRSFNHATDAHIRNAAGYAGAFFAVPLLQIFGLAVMPLVLAPIAWGWRILRRQGISRMWLRITLLALCLPSLAGAFSLVDRLAETSEAWPAPGWGGYIGKYIQGKLLPLLTPWGYGVSVILLAAVSLFYAMGLNRAQWGNMIGFFRGISSMVVRAGGVLLILPRTVMDLRARLRQWAEGSEYEGEEAALPKSTRKPKKEKPVKDKEIAAPRKVITTKKRAATRADQDIQQSFDLAEMRRNYQLPPLSLLTTPVRKNKAGVSESALSQNAQMLEKVLEDYGVNGKIIEVQPGPVVTLYALEPSAGTKSSRIIGLADDIARSMSAQSARIAVIPGRNAIGIELPNSTRETVYLKELLQGDAYRKNEFSLPLALGKDISGEPQVIDLAKTPHMLVAGTTGSGKSVGINAMILSLLYRYSPDECKFIMVDPKMLELSVYQDIPHLLAPVVTESGKAVVALKWVVKEMEQRYRLMSNLGVRNVKGYNEKILEAAKKGQQLTRTVQTGFNPDTGEPIVETLPLTMTPLPFIVVIVDEMADLMIVAGKDIEVSVQRLAQMARAEGIHVILATQRPSVDVITGVIKANFPTRLSFQVSSKIDSRTIIGESGAEQLLGQGDMLYMSGGGRLTRMHGPFVEDSEVEKVVEFVKKQGAPAYIEDVTKEEDAEMDGDMEGGGSGDPLYDQAVAIVTRDGKASTSYVQRQLRIGYNKAANLIEQMEREGIVGPATATGKREVLVDR